MNITANGQEFCSECSRALTKFAGSSIYIPKRGDNNYDKMRELRKSGWTITAIADEFNLSIRSVYRILSGAK